MSNLDEISRALGSIEAQLTNINNELKDAKVNSKEIRALIADQSGRLQLIEKEFAEDVIPAIDEFNKLKNRGYGILLGVSIMSAGAASVVMKFLKIT